MVHNTNQTQAGLPIDSSFQLTRSTTRFIGTLKQSLFALSFDVGGLVAGSILVMFSDVFSLASWVLIIYPSILSMRGVIGGLFSGRLSTGLHLGTVKPSFTKNTPKFHVLLSAITVLTFQSSLMMGTIASLLSVSIWGASFIDVINVFSIILTTMGLSLLFVSPATMSISFIAFKYGLDPDIIVYPVISTLADILVTICFILALRGFFPFGQLGTLLAGLFDVAFLILVVFVSAKYRKEKEFTKTIREFSVTLAVVTLIVNVTGNVLGQISRIIGRRPEIYVLYPALIDTVGDVGSIVGSTATTKLALGTLGSSFRSVGRNFPEICGACISSTIWFIAFAFISFYIGQGAITANALLWLIVELVALSILATPIMSLISYSTAVFTFRQGLDPDNFVIPFESSLSDSVTTICLLAVINLLQ